MEHPSAKKRKYEAIKDQGSSKGTSEKTQTTKDRPIIESSSGENGSTSLLLFYQYVEPSWSDDVYKEAKETVQKIGRSHNITGRMRVAKEGLNCTLSGTQENLYAFIHSLRAWKDIFRQTEFKLTHHLPDAQRFKDLKIIPVQELVHYGLDGKKAPPTSRYHGTHLEPREYHQKLQEKDTVVIDVRNHYEANIGKFDAPGYLDPKMRKSTEFPVWLDSDTTKEQLQNKQVMMFCTGGIRCERAVCVSSVLLFGCLFVVGA